MFHIRFWGVRGSIACPSPEFAKYGGNTSCVSMQCGNQHLVFDAGTGIRSYGRWLLTQPQRSACLLLSHTHWDHINGFPFFEPAYRADFDISIRAGHLLSQNMTVKEVLAGQMSNPTFPVPMDIMSARLDFADFHSGSTLELNEGVVIKTAALRHPNGATGYRVEYGGKSACYVTDTEHDLDERNQEILRLIQNSDLVIYDSTYTDEEFPEKLGWGHSTWQEGVRLCKAANVKQLLIFHHDPDHDDAFMDQVAQQASALWSGALVARDGMRIELEP